MTKTRRLFTPEERLSIVQEGQRKGRAATIRKYDIALDHLIVVAGYYCFVDNGMV